MILSRRQLPNLISVGRILLVLPIVWALIHEHFLLALVLFAVAGLSDGLDGFLAKHFQWQSRLGSILDPIADKLLLVACFAALTWIELIPLWLLVLVLGRDVWIVAGALAYHWIVGAYDLKPLFSSKLNTFLQIALILLIILQQQWFSLLAPVTQLCLYAVVITVIYSGIAYTVIWGKFAWQQIQKN